MRKIGIHAIGDLLRRKIESVCPCQRQPVIIKDCNPLAFGRFSRLKSGLFFELAHDRAENVDCSVGLDIGGLKRAAGRVDPARVEGHPRHAAIDQRIIAGQHDRRTEAVAHASIRPFPITPGDEAREIGGEEPAGKTAFRKLHLMAHEHLTVPQRRVDGYQLLPMRIDAHPLALRKRPPLAGELEIESIDRGLAEQHHPLAGENWTWYTNLPPHESSSMSRDSRYDILFEPVRIGPVTARNRFYQVPHCNGMGYRDVSALAAMRGTKAEGGWAVVCTEMAEIHYGADVAPYVE